MKVKTIPELADAAGVSVATIKRAINDGEIERAKDRTFDVEKAKDAVSARALRRGGQPMGGNGAGAVMSPALHALKVEQAREELDLTKAKRMKMQQELARSTGEILLTADVKKVWAELLIEFRDRMRAIPGQVAARIDPRRAREIAEMIREPIDATLAALAEESAIRHEGMSKG